MPAAMTSVELLAALASRGVLPQGVADDSRQVRPGDVFLAYPGALVDGRNFIAEALARGAVAVLWEAGGGFEWRPEWRVAQLCVPQLRRLSGTLAHAVHGYPCERLSLIAVTGTNGKTTTTQWIAQTHPKACAVMGTLGAGLPGKLEDTGFTTPEATTLTRYLAGFAADGVQACALEASSIGIEEGRLSGARVDVAVLTNLTRDHLDYHGNMESYAAAKTALFNWPHLRLAVLNLDDPFGREMAARSTASKIVGYTQLADVASRHQGVVFAENIEEKALGGLRFRLHAPSGRAMVETRVIGRYNVANLLAVAAVLIDAGLRPAEVAERFSGLQAPPGRLETLGGDDAPLVVVDYAHTPDALKNALSALRTVAEARGGRLLCLFGCGGDRDRGKRPLMGEIARRLADRVILSSDNPRSESPQSIIDDILSGAPGLESIIDRAAAIRQTVLDAASGDVLLVAGKGHEPYQEIAGQRRAYSDIEEVRNALNARREQKQ